MKASDYSIPGKRFFRGEVPFYNGLTIADQERVIEAVRTAPLP
jgi:hypothetical protein